MQSLTIITLPFPCKYFPINTLISKFRKLIEGKMFVSQSWRHTICQGVWDQFYIAFLWMSNCISIFQASRQNLITILVSLYSQYLILLKDLNLLEGILNVVSKTDLNEWMNFIDYVRSPWYYAWLWGSGNRYNTSIVLISVWFIESTHTFYCAYVFVKWF